MGASVRLYVCVCVCMGGGRLSDELVVFASPLKTFYDLYCLVTVDTFPDVMCGRRLPTHTFR
jgi:hypothetical protein